MECWLAVNDTDRLTTNEAIQNSSESTSLLQASWLLPDYNLKQGQLTNY